MRTLYKTKKIILGIFAVIVFCVLTLIACVYLDSLEYEPSVKAGEVATFIMKVRIEPGADVDDNRLVVAVLVPKVWNADENTTVTYVSTLNPGSTRTMSLIPKGSLPKKTGGLTWDAALRDRFGFGPNVLDDMEWLVYWSDDVESLTVRENFTADVKVEIQTGPENLKAKLGFFVNHTDDGFSGDQDHYKILYTDCFEVYDGEGIPMDFCEPHFNMFQPSRVTNNDIVTLSFQGGIQPNALDDVDEIYLCATAYTDKGNVYDVMDKTEKSKMVKGKLVSKTYSLTFWLGEYFNVPKDESIIRIEYYFSNKDGSLWVKETDEDGVESLFVTPCTCP